jgi:hypothetical protein
MNTEIISLPKFSGYTHEDAAKFLAEFDSYMTLQCPDIHHELSSARQIAAFHMHLPGPAQIWLISFHPQTKLVGKHYLRSSGNSILAQTMCMILP